LKNRAFGVEYQNVLRKRIDQLSKFALVMLKLGFSALEIIDISSTHVPADRATACIAQGLIASEKPSILPVFPSGSLLILKRLTSRQRLLSFIPQPLDIFGMKDSIAKVRVHHIIDG